MKKEFKKMLRIIANDNNTTPENVYREMQIAIDSGFDNPDPKVQALWKQIPFKGDRPKPEDVVPYLALLVNMATELSGN